MAVDGVVDPILEDRGKAVVWGDRQVTREPFLCELSIDELVVGVDVGESSAIYVVGFGADGEFHLLARYEMGKRGGSGIGAALSRILSVGDFGSVDADQADGGFLAALSEHERVA